MVCRVSTLCDKDVINIKDGCRLGCVDDVEVDLECADILAIIVYGKKRWFGLLGRCEDMIIRWKEIRLVGEDTVLVDIDCGRYVPKKKNGFFSFLFQ